MGILKIYFLRCWDHGESQSKNLSGGQSHPGQPGHQHTVHRHIHFYPIIRQYTTANRVIHVYTTGGDQMVSNLLGKKVYACDLK